MAAQQVFAPLTSETFNKSNITFGKPHDITEYNFRKVRIGYSNEDSTDDDFNVLIKATVLHSTPPNEKCRTHSALLRVTDESTINFVNQLDEDVAGQMFKNRKTLFDGIEIKNVSAIDKLKTQKLLVGYRKKGLLSYNKDYNSYSFGITFGKDITIEHSDVIPEEQRNADDIVGQLVKGTEVVIAANLNTLSINTKTLKWNLKFTASQIGCISVSQMGGGERNPADIWGITPSDIDTSNLVFQDVKTNNYGGKSLPVKYSGKGKETNLTLKFDDVSLYFNESKDKSGNKLGRFSVAIDMSDEYKSKFDELDEGILNHLFKNQSQFVDGEETDNIDIFSDAFNGSLNEREGNYTLWANLYVKKDEAGEYDFDEKIYHATGEDDEGNPTFEVMSNTDIMKTLIEGKDKATGNISVYIRYVWLGESYSVKWYMSKAQVFTKTAKKFNLGISSIVHDEEVDEFDGPTADLVEEDPTEVVSEDEATTEEESD
jgi:hypothetical protein